LSSLSPGCFDNMLVVCCQLRGTLKTLIAHDGQLVASSWRDTGVVYMLSVCLPVHHRSTVVRRQKTGFPLSVTCLLAHVMFNAHMGGVDNFDHMRQGEFVVVFFVFLFVYPITSILYLSPSLSLYVIIIYLIRSIFSG
jgi:hypothetical protein